MNACVVGIAAMFVAGCGSDGGPFASVGGVYKGSVTNEGSTCPGMLDKGTMSNVVLTIDQMGANVTLVVDGLTSPSLQAIFGTNSFAGTVIENHIRATITGMVPATLGGCMYTLNGELAANLGGNILTGNIIYTPQTNGHADCRSMQVTGCISKQTFGFTRTP
jgi:hypothetical protein